VEVYAYLRQIPILSTPARVAVHHGALHSATPKKAAGQPRISHRIAAQTPFHTEGKLPFAGENAIRFRTLRSHC
jgi:hypothetical protein